MTNRIEWTTESVEMPAIDTSLMERWLSRVAASHDRVLGMVVYKFCDDPTILDVNRRFLNHDYFTDIITFDYSRGKLVSGDIVLSLDTVASNAAEIGVDPQRELYRVIVHGVLHLCGIDDKGPGEREIMEAAEDAALAILDEELRQQQQ